ncbi:hypothetical protein TNCT_568961 [Trichonephila clavata]|uniref:Uncharacterized protein n=1 Tax=Trichonephila clavata TaxID=2740835 RepID=A0A8X6H0D2_TRICU|nr:hypothetical protein TNCT_568961 [Trichonephila clavata]
MDLLTCFRTVEPSLQNTESRVLQMSLIVHHRLMNDIFLSLTLAFNSPLLTTAVATPDDLLLTGRSSLAWSSNEQHSAGFGNS